MTEIIDPSLPWNQNVEGDAPAQLVNSNESNLRVQAGPGTGKSYCVKKRVLRVLHPMGLDLSGNDVLLRFLSQCESKITDEAVREIVEEPRNKARGQGGAVLWDRAKRYVDLKEQLPIPTDASDGICKLFSADIWLPDADPTAATDLELLLHAAQEMVVEILEITPDRPPGEILAEVARRLRYMIATREPFEPEEQRHLQITTPSGAKGVTANHVYILGLSDAAILGEKRLDYPGSDEEFLDEQRRLFYVSLTRSTNTLVLSRALWIGFGEAKQLNFTVQYTNKAAISLPATRFLRDIVGKLPPAQNGEKWAGCES